MGEVIHGQLKDEDKARTDSSNLTGVIGDMDKFHIQVRVAIQLGLLRHSVDGGKLRQFLNGKHHIQLVIRQCHLHL